MARESPTTACCFPLYPPMIQDFQLASLPGGGGGLGTRLLHALGEVHYKLNAITRALEIVSILQLKRLQRRLSLFGW